MSLFTKHFPSICFVDGGKTLDAGVTKTHGSHTMKKKNIPTHRRINKYINLRVIITVKKKKKGKTLHFLTLLPQPDTIFFLPLSSFENFMILLLLLFMTCKYLSSLTMYSWKNSLIFFDVGSSLSKQPFVTTLKSSYWTFYVIPAHNKPLQQNTLFSFVGRPPIDSGVYAFSPIHSSSCPPPLPLPCVVSQFSIQLSAARNPKPSPP